MKKSILSIFLALILALSLFACGEKRGAQDSSTAETVSFTDSAGRTVEVPKNITRVAPSGAFAQMYLFALAPDYFARRLRQAAYTQRKK